MMYDIHEAIDCVDQELAGLMPELKRRRCTPRVMEQADALLDTRNYLVSILGELAFDEYERLMTE